MSLLAELKRRNVFKVGAAYLALAWVIVQITGTVVPAFGMPEWTLKFVIWLGVIGLPVVVGFAWVFELTPEGLKRESEVDRSRSITHATGKRLDYIIIAMLGIAMLMFAADRFVPRNAAPAPASDNRAEARPAESARDVDARGSDRADPVRSDSTESDPAISDPAAGRASVRQQASDSARLAPDEKSIAVLPFVNMSSDKEQEYFSDGIAEELLNSLAKIPELKVIARTSSFAFKGKEVDIAEIAHRLNVAHVLEGSVRKSGNRVRVTAQLIRTTDSTHLWSETYDRSLDDIFAVQDEIARNVVDQLKIKLLGAAPRTDARNPEAYALTLQARAMANQFTKEGNSRAVELFRQALALDPRNAVAWDGLARVYMNMASVGQMPEAEAFRQAREAVAKALDSDAGYAPAHARLGFLTMTTGEDQGSATGHFRRALELAPADPETLGGALGLIQQLGRYALANEIGEFLVARDPVSAAGYRQLCQTRVLAGELDAGIAACRTALSLSPGTANANYLIGLAWLQRGDAQAALAAFANETDEEYRIKGMAAALYTLGRKEEFAEAFATLRERWGAQWPSEVAQVYAWTGDADTAFAWLDKALAQGESGMLNQYQQVLYRPVHGDPRWVAFRERTGTSEAQLAAITFDIKVPG